jgi:hypothetical protein
MTNLRYENVNPTKRHRIDVLPSRHYPGQTYERRITEVKHCGKWLVCDSFTNTCGCGTDFNSAGQRLAPRFFWGEETGEHWADLIRIR